MNGDDCLTNPRIEIDLEKIEHNTKVIVNKCCSQDIDVAGVTKVFCGDMDVALAMVKGGVKYLADSRMQNIINLSKIEIPKILLRVPMQSEIEDVVKYCDLSLNSEIDTIRKIGIEAKKQHKVHKVILMVDLGDLREGIWHEDFPEFLDSIAGLHGIEIHGIGTNLTCFGGVIPSYENLSLLLDITKKAREQYDIQIPVVSGGNSSSLHLLDKGEMPEGINNLRIGEAIALGRETAFGKRLDDMYDDAVMLYGEIVEIKYKPSKPIGNIGVDAFGNPPEIEDMGPRYRAIVAVGRQDIELHGVFPDDAGVKAIGASSDHLIVDITDSKINYSPGDEIGFKINYGSLLRSMTSPYVKKIKKF